MAGLFVKDLKRLGSDDYKRLETGQFSDCSVVCGDRTWRTHKLILCRVKYFEKVLLSDRILAAVDASGESRKDEIIITEFPPFEVDILLRYIYDPVINISDIYLKTPNTSFLETCVRVGILGEHFGIQSLSLTAAAQLQGGCKRPVSNAEHLDRDEIPFVNDLELGIRVAWGPRRAPPQCQSALVQLCMYTAPRLRVYQTIMPLFDEIPKFASDFSKAALTRDAGHPLSLMSLVEA